MTTLITFFSQIYYFREYFKQSVLRDLKNKYKRSSLGYLWTMLHPLGMMGVLAVVFSHLMRFPIKDYAIFVFCGILTWNYFQSTVMMSLHSIKANSKLFGQVAVPKYIFVLSIAFSNLINLLLAFCPLMLLFFIVGRSLPPTIILFPIMLVPLFCMTVAISLLVAAANVFFDDTLHLTEVILQAVYFLCPVLYGRDMLPAHLVNYLQINPVFSQIEFVRDVVYNGTIPDPLTFGLNLIVSLFILFVCVHIFSRAEDKFLYFI